MLLPLSVTTPLSLPSYQIYFLCHEDFSSSSSFIYYLKYLKCSWISERGFIIVTYVILLQLFERDPSRRLGVVGDIRAHLFFKTVNWLALENREVEPPFKPKVVWAWNHVEPEIHSCKYNWMHLMYQLLHNALFPVMSPTEIAQWLQQLWPRVPEREASAVPRRQEPHWFHGPVCICWLFLCQPKTGTHDKQMKKKSPLWTQSWPRTLK